MWIMTPYLGDVSAVSRQSRESLTRNKLNPDQRPNMNDRWRGVVFVPCCFFFLFFIFTYGVVFVLLLSENFSFVK